MAFLESAALALAISGRLVGAAQLHLGGALCRDDRALDMTKVAENSSSQPMLTVFTYRPTKIQPTLIGGRARARASERPGPCPLFTNVGPAESLRSGVRLFLSKVMLK